MAGVLGEEALDEVFESARDVRAADGVRTAFEVLVSDGVRGRGLEDAPSGEHLVQHAAQCVQVRARYDAFAA
nr:hypothetical protein [Actinomadura sp. J1-007]